MNKPKHIPWLLLLIGGGFLIMMVGSIYLASQRTSPVTDRDYYSHGLRYNETLLERQAAASLGWTTTIKLQGNRMTILLLDRDQGAVAHATGRLTLFDRGKGHDLMLELEETEPGTYVTELPSGLHGEQPAEISFERTGSRLNKRLLISLP